MCQIPSNPLHTIVEVSELFQEFLKHASIDGFVESWCLEIRLRSNAGDIPNELPIDCMHHLIGLHSLNYLILKRLDERHHELTLECCSCGWEVSHIPEFQHSEIHRYTPGTIIRWSQGECHVLLAPSDRYEPLNQGSGGDPSSDPEELQKEDPSERTLEGATPQQAIREEEFLKRSGVIQSTEQSLSNGKKDSDSANSPDGDDDAEATPTEEDPPEGEVASNSQYFIKHQHFCEEDADCHSHHQSQLNTVDERDIEETVPDDANVRENAAQSPWMYGEASGEKNVLDGSFTNGVSEDDEENSRMLVINEDDNSQEPVTSDRKESDSGPNADSPPHAYTFHRVLPLTADNVRAHSGEKRPLSPASPQKEEEEDSRDSDNDDDSSSVSSSSSSSSSSTSSSSTSSDDDDRINFKKRVEQAAQAAREAAASAAASVPPFQENTPLLTIAAPHENAPLPNKDSNAFPIPCSKGNMLEDHHDAAVDSFAAASTPPHMPPTAPFVAYRHPDDIQAAQGLAALGKSHEFKGTHSLQVNLLPAIGKVTLKTTTTSKIAQKLLQNKNVDVRRVGQKSFQCGVCGKLFSRLPKALEHQVSHTGEKPWECDSCDRKFAKYHSMQKHKRVKHTPSHLQEFTCYICEKNFGVQSALQMHLATHATLKPFSCSVCGQTFALKFTKEAHEAQHTGNRPWCCSVCGKTFVTKYKLNAHMKAHTGELFCSICNRTFSSQDVLTRHKRRHEAAKGTQSSDASNSKQNSSKRRKTPLTKGRGRSNSKGATSFESPPSPPPTSEFRCQMCNKTFMKSTDLTHHLASCNAITYCPPSNIQTGIPGTSLLPENGASQTLNIHPPPEQPPNPHQIHHQPLSSATPLTACMLVEEKKLPHFTPCATPTDVAENMEGLDRRSFMMNTLQTQNMTSVTPFQLQEMVVQTTSNPVPESLPDYLSEVAFGTASGNASTIIFQPANGQG